MGKIIKLHALDRQSTPLIINGRRVDVPHNRDFPLADAYVELLQNSGKNFTILGPIAESKSAGAPPAAAGAKDAGLSDAPADNPFGQIPGGSALTDAPPQDPAVTVTIPAADQSNQQPGGSNLTHAGSVDPALREAAATERQTTATDEAIEARQQSADGTIEPIVELTNRDPDQTGEVGFDAADFLEGSVADVTARLDKLTPDQRALLIDAEKRGKNRSTLLAELEKGE